MYKAMLTLRLWGKQIEVWCLKNKKFLGERMIYDIKQKKKGKWQMKYVWKGQIKQNYMI